MASLVFHLCLIPGHEESFMQRRDGTFRKLNKRVWPCSYLCANFMHLDMTFKRIAYCSSSDCAAIYEFEMGDSYTLEQAQAQRDRILGATKSFGSELLSVADAESMCESISGINFTQSGSGNTIKLSGDGLDDRL